MDSLRHVVQTESRYWSSLPLGFPQLVIVPGHAAIG